MLIVEGTDLVGKTTLCHALTAELAKDWPCTYAWFGRLPETWNYYWCYLLRMSRWVIQDRFHMSEIVYRKARDEHQRLYPQTYRLLDAQARLLGSVTVVVLSTDALIRAEYDVRRDEETHTLQQILHANRLFAGLAEGHGALHNEYGPVDCDFVHVAGERAGWPGSNVEFIKKVTTLYVERQACIHSLLQGRRHEHESLR